MYTNAKHITQATLCFASSYLWNDAKLKKKPTNKSNQIKWLHIEPKTVHCFIREFDCIIQLQVISFDEIFPVANSLIKKHKQINYPYHYNRQKRINVIVIEKITTE